MVALSLISRRERTATHTTPLNATERACFRRECDWSLSHRRLAKSPCR
jgi:hypothetical protein